MRFQVAGYLEVHIIDDAGPDYESLDLGIKIDPSGGTSAVNEAGHLHYRLQQPVRLIARQGGVGVYGQGTLPEVNPVLARDAPRPVQHRPRQRQPVGVQVAQRIPHIAQANRAVGERHNFKLNRFPVGPEKRSD